MGILELCCHEEQNYQKQGERPGSSPSWAVSEEAQFYQHLYFRLVASRTVRQCSIVYTTQFMEL